MKTSAFTLGRLASVALLTGASVMAMATAPVRADDNAGVARVSLINGTVTVQRGDSGDIVAAIINAPVMAGDYLSTANDTSRAEVQLDAANLLRAGAGTQLRFTQLDPTQDTVQIAAGAAELRVLSTSDLHPQVQTPSVTIRPDDPGRYRVTVNGDGTTEFTVRSGRADLVTPQGSQTIAAGHSVLVSGSSSNPQIAGTAFAAYDGFDSWNDDCDEYYTRAASGPYAGSGIVGLNDLDTYGHWVYQPNYGQVWVAYNYPPGWAPYHYGRWVWEPYYGWTWVGYEPWGWAPYHYGNWFWAPAYGWAWYPGPVIVRPVWRPALVAFFGFGGGGYGGGFSFNLTFGNVGWVPLAPYEPYHPWWGPAWVNHTTIINNYYDVTNVNIAKVYRNAAVPGGVAVVRGENLTDGGVYRYVPVHSGDLQNVGVVKGALPVVPTRDALAFTKGGPTGANHTTALSTHFSSMPAAAKLPPSFAQQQNAAQTVAKAYAAHGVGTNATGSTNTNAHATNANVRTNASGPTSAWSRFNNGNGITPSGNTTTIYHPGSQTSEQWSSYQWSKGGKNAYHTTVHGQSGNGQAVTGATNGGSSGAKGKNAHHGSKSGGDSGGNKGNQGSSGGNPPSH